MIARLSLILFLALLHWSPAYADVHSRRLVADADGKAQTVLDLRGEAKGLPISWAVAITPAACDVHFVRPEARRTKVKLDGDGFYVVQATIGAGAQAITRSIAIEVVKPNRTIEAAGLSEPFAMPEPLTGAVLDVTDFGATPNDDSDDDGLAVNAALEVAQPGDSVVFPKGTFHFQSTITIEKSHLGLFGVSAKETRLVGQLERTGSTRRLITIREGSQDLQLAYFTITRSSGELFYGMEIGRTNPTTGPYAVERIWIDNVGVHQFDGRGLNLRTTKHVLITNAFVSRAASDLEDGGNGYGITMNSRSSNNVVAHCLIGPQVRHGVLIQSGSNHNLIEACDVRGSLYDCYDLHAFESSSEPLTIRENHNELRYNVARGSTRAGFKIGNPTWGASGPNNWIHHNEVFNCERGVEVIQGSDFQVIESNYIHGLVDKDDFGLGGVAEDRRYGVWLRNGGGDSIQILANLFTKCRVGIGVEEGDDLTVTSNTFRRNDLGIQTAIGVLNYAITWNFFRPSNDQATDLGTPPPAGGIFEHNVGSN